MDRQQDGLTELRLSRTGWGIVAGVAAVAAVFVVQTVEVRLFGTPTRAVLWGTFVGTGGSILWLADHFGLLASPYTEPPAGLGGGNRTRPNAVRVTLEAFLKAGDLDDLLRVRRGLSSLTPEETLRVRSVIHQWSDRQAVANLLFHPDLIPDSLRLEALDRALHSNDVAYFVLAATVGLQQLEPAAITVDRRDRWLVRLLTLIQSESETLANRASLILYSWTQELSDPDILPELLSIYPVADQGACRNIVAALLSRCGELPAHEFDARLREWRVSESPSALLRRAYGEHRQLTMHDAYRAKLMTMPSFAYIPNLVERPADIGGQSTMRGDPDGAGSA